jgi:diguanylate cyclase (GGDEF)-like protein/PAS domain S-box-containing protein
MRIDSDRAVEADLQHASSTEAAPANLVLDEPSRITGTLQDSELRYRRLFETAQDGILILDADTGQITDVNPYLTDMLGYTHTEMLGKALWEIGPFKDVAESRAAFRQLQDREYIRYANLPLETKTAQTRQVEFVSNLYMVAGKRVIQCNVRDITERSHVSAELRRDKEELLTVVATLQQRDRELQLLNRMIDLLQRCTAEEEAYGLIERMAPQLFAGQSGYLASVGAEDPSLETVARWGDDAPPVALFSLEDCLAMQRGRPHEVVDPRTSPLCRHFGHEPSGASLCVPLTICGETLGLLCLFGDAESEENRADRNRLGVTVGEAVTLCLSNLRRQEKLREQAIRDPLTGLANRRYLEESLPRELHRASRERTALSIAMLDLDHFKRFNDAFGHDPGDSLLREVGRVLNEKLRKSDIACRYGGEEFVLVLPNSSLADIFERIDEIRLAVRDLQIRHGDRLLGAVTVSAGVAEARDGMTARELLREADEALYGAKRAGRDRVVLYEKKEIDSLRVG